MGILGPPLAARLCSPQHFYPSAQRRENLLAVWAEGFWEELLSSDEALLHRLGALIACVLGLIEYQARIKRKPNSRLPYLMPVLCAAGGLLLLGHAHEGLQPKEDFLIQITHNAIGLLAVIMACGRWLELRLTPSAGRLAGVVSLSALLVVGLILLFYRETPAL
jgi:putative copper resistance protein D